MLNIELYQDHKPIIVKTTYILSNFNGFRMIDITVNQTFFAYENFS